MTIPKEIVEKMKQVNSLMTEIDSWMDDNIELNGSKHNHKQQIIGEYKHPDYYQFTDEAQGEEQNDGEYCDQWPASGDSFEGFYYYPTESNEYFYFQFCV